MEKAVIKPCYAAVEFRICETWRDAVAANVLSLIFVTSTAWQSKIATRSGTDS
jgi:hypothetical protein